MSDSESVGRRGFLVTAGAAAGAVLGSAQPVTADHPTQKPSHVTTRYDEDVIRRYQPSLIVDGVEHEPYTYASMVVESPEYDLSCVVGFHRYTHQTGFSSEDSHYGDMEPVYVFFDSATQTTVQVVYSGYHWFQADAYSNTLRFSDSSEERPILRVVPPYHHYTTEFSTTEVSDVATDIPISDLTGRYSEWLTDEELEDEIRDGAVYTPWRMQDWDSWWDPTAMSEIEAALRRLYLVWQGVKLT